MSTGANEKRMRLRYEGRCRVCDAALGARAEAIYERTTKTVRCIACVAPDGAQLPADLSAPADAAPRFAEVSITEDSASTGVAGASARRQYERRQAKREERIRAKHPKLGGLILALSDDPQSTTAWKSGAQGEERLGERLNQLETRGMGILHDRRIPGTRANIDHLAIAPSGVYVIDAKRYVGKRPTLRIDGGMLRPRVETLLVGSRDQSKLVDGVLRQVDVVKAQIGDDTPVNGVLCFIDADWPLIGGSFSTRKVEVLWPKKLIALLTADGPHSPRIDELTASLRGALPPA